MPSLEKINRAADADAAALLEPFIERAPVLAARVAQRRPFPSIDALRDALYDELLKMPPQERIALFNAHPELAPSDPGAMTSASQTEQARLGLTSQINTHGDKITGLNERYREKFGFPFITALARHPDLNSVLGEFETRLRADIATEMRTAIEQIHAVSSARIRTGVVLSCTDSGAK